MNNIHLHIIGSESFFNLLDELNLNYTVSFDKNLKYKNQNFLVRIIFLEKVHLSEAKKYFLENVPTIFLLKNKDYLKKNNLKLLEFHISLFVPVEILSLREIINILLTKYNFFKKSKIIINDYEIDSNQRVISRNGIQTKLTEKELELILTLNKNNGLKKSFLLQKIWNHNSELESHAFETHLHRLRKKIDKFFKDKNFIIEKNSSYYLSK
ncbi:OmpR Response regulators consisting of a CheY-like receiver domain and a winged-helix DNA-binding domain [Candidatus Pelagibacterales bacterium]